MRVSHHRARRRWRRTHARRLAAELEIPAVERDIWPAELHCADAAFVCGSGAGIVPVGSFDGRPVVHPGHPWIGALQAAYRARTRDPGYRTELYAEREDVRTAL